MTVLEQLNLILLTEKLTKPYSLLANCPILIGRQLESLLLL